MIVSISCPVWKQGADHSRHVIETQRWKKVDEFMGMVHRATGGRCGKCGARLEVKSLTEEK